MKLAIALFALLATTATARAATITIKPRNPIDCKQPEERWVSYITAVVNDSGDNVSITGELTYGTCRNGVVDYKTVGPVFNMYVIDMEYSRSFASNYSITAPGTLTLNLQFNTRDFFSVRNDRHIELHFFPSSGTLSFYWDLTATMDPVTKQISYQITPR